MKRLPDLPDLMAAGMGLSEALEAWRIMMNSGDIAPERWWRELEEYRLNSRRKGAQTEPDCDVGQASSRTVH
jgi:hypothetical protein